MQFGRVVDATLMIDKDTGRPRGFGFVTFDSEAAVEAALSQPLDILGKPIEVKKAQPRGNLRDQESQRGRGRDFNRDMGQDGGQQQGAQGQGMGGMTPQVMAQYWQRMQQYFAMMQQQMAMANSQGQGMGGGMGMGGMNPAMMQQMQQMQQMQMKQQQGSGGMSPNPQSPGSQQGMQNMMNPAMMQQMQQNQGQGQMSSGGNGGASPGPNAAYNSQAAAAGGPGYNAQEQIAFEQQKYEQQQQTRRGVDNRAFSPYQQGGPTSWEGMYDEVPQPNIPTGPQGMARGGSMGRGMAAPSPFAFPSLLMTGIIAGATPQPQSTAPANAPTGPRNAGKPGANYRGGGRGGHRGFHPYSRG